MTNDVLLSIPLFVLMGYVMERGALVDKMFYSIQLAFRRVPASLAVATLIVCTFWGIASGLVGAVVVLVLHQLAGISIAWTSRAGMASCWLVVAFW
jgi:TRAP-type mannitol/chloroaromatic compound transport system permease large subunit